VFFRHDGIMRFFDAPRCTSNTARAWLRPTAATERPRCPGGQLGYELGHVAAHDADRDVALEGEDDVRRRRSKRVLVCVALRSC
jgi:hypothetical protein